MYNLPIDSSICGNYIFHEGNHNGNGNPHKQYINTWDTFRTPVYITSLSTQYVKIAEITYEKDNNTALGYRIELINEFNTDKNGYINITVGNTGVINFTLNNNSYCDAYYTSETIESYGKPKAKISIYLK